MKKLLVMMFITGAVTACNTGTESDNAADSAIDAIDSAADAKIEKIDSARDARIDRIDSLNDGRDSADRDDSKERKKQ